MARENRARIRAARAAQRKTGRSYTATLRSSALSREEATTVLAVASARGGRGCSTHVASLAVAMSRMGLRALAVGLSRLPKPDATHLLGAPQETAYEDHRGWIVAPAPADSRVSLARWTSERGGAVITEAEQLIDRARGHFDVVLLDASMDRDARDLAGGVADRVFVPVAPLDWVVDPGLLLPFREGVDRVLAELDLAYFDWWADQDDEDGREDDYENPEAAEGRRKARYAAFLAQVDERRIRGWGEHWSRAREQWPEHYEATGTVRLGTRAGAENTVEEIPGMVLDLMTARSIQGLDMRVDGIIVSLWDGLPPVLRDRLSAQSATHRSRVPGLSGPVPILAPWIADAPELRGPDAPGIAAHASGDCAQQYRQLADAVLGIARS